MRRGPSRADAGPSPPAAAQSPRGPRALPAAPNPAGMGGQWEGGVVVVPVPQEVWGRGLRAQPRASHALRPPQ